jgi:spore maturation protein CgeB
MRILIVDTCYDAFLDAHYRAQPGLAESGYDEQWQSLMQTRFGTSDAYSHNLAKAGVEAHEVVINAEPLQQAWAREHGTATGRDDLVLEQVRGFEADVVYFQNMHALEDATLAALRRDGKLVVGQIASAAPKPERVRLFDLVLTSFPHYVERFRNQGVSSEYFRIGFDPRILDALPALEPGRDVVFVGALNGLRHRRGNRVFAKAARSPPIEFWGYDLRGWLPGSPIRRGYRG